MKKLNRGLIAIAAVSVMGVSMFASQPTTANASTAVKVLKTTNLKNSTVHLSGKGNIYSSNKLTKVAWKISDWKNVSFTRYSQVTVKKSNGKKAIYQYIKANGVKGWVWHNYIVSGSAKSANQVSASNKTAYINSALKTLNSYRVKHGRSALKLNSALNGYAQTVAFNGWQCADTFGNRINYTNSKIDGSAVYISAAEPTTSKTKWINFGKIDALQCFDKNVDSSYTSQAPRLMNASYKNVGIGIYTTDDFSVMGYTFSK